MSSNSQFSLEAGLVALNQGDYQGAIAILKAVVTEAEVSYVSLQARMGLVIAYTRNGNIPQATSLCENLTKSDNTQIQEWAEKTLGELSIRHPPENDSVEYTTGFVPFSSSFTPESLDIKVSGTLEKNAESSTGFVPLDNLSSPLPPAPSLPTKASKSLPRPSHPPTPNLKVGNTGKVPSKKPGQKYSVTNSQSTNPRTIQWRKAQRAKVWQPLNPVNLTPLRLLAAGTFIAMFWLVRELVKWLMGTTNYVLVKLPFLQPLQFLYKDPSNILLLILLIAVGASPWTLDWLFKNWYNQKPLNKETLNRYSHEAIRVLHRYCQQRGWDFPKLKIVPMAVPIAFAYGNLPLNTRIVVSQGLLEQLEVDEIATIYASQLAHIRHWDVAVMSLVLLITIPIYQLYQYISAWGDCISLPWAQKILSIISSLVYVVWYTFSFATFPLSQVRIYHSDRVACDTTGNPNGLSRAILKIAMGIANDVDKQAHTSWQLKSLNSVIPISHHQGLSLGSIAPQVTFESFLMWDNLNPYSRWFTLNSSHPLIGARISKLGIIARRWHIPAEINIESQPSLRLKHQSFLLHIAPWLGIPTGMVFAFFIWLVWQIAYAIKWLNVKWIYDDWGYVWGCMLIGFSIGILVRINFFFPEIRPDTIKTEKKLPNYLNNPAALPIDSMSVLLIGTLLGIRGVGNSIGQDLILRTKIGLVKLHHIPWWGKNTRPQDLIGRQVMVTGWARRGATPWIDIHTLKTQAGKPITSPHQIFSVVIATGATAWGAYLLLTG
ncbi:protease htpX-like protein [Richelia intracellularis]|nr:protease htpX-like protein [Richelia intracellularis]